MVDRGEDETASNEDATTSGPGPQESAQAEDSAQAPGKEPTEDKIDQNETAKQEPEGPVVDGGEDDTASNEDALAEDSAQAPGEEPTENIAFLVLLNLIFHDGAMEDKIEQTEKQGSEAKEVVVEALQPEDGNLVDHKGGV